MIRFSCRRCGKSLRADESIIGRSTQCTACRAVNRVPAESTRKSGEKPDRLLINRSTGAVEEKDEFEDEVVTLIADSDPDSFAGFEDLDLSSLKVEAVLNPTSPVEPLSQHREDRPVTERIVESRSRPQIVPNLAATNERANWARKSETKFGSNYWQPSRSVVSSRILLMILGLGLLVPIGYVGYLKLLAAKPDKAKTQLELSAVGNRYSQELLELKKAARVMTYLERAYLEKKLPDAGLSNVQVLKQEIDQLVNETGRLEEANRQYDAGDTKGANQILNQQIELMSKLKTRLDQESSSLKLKVYGQ